MRKKNEPLRLMSALKDMPPLYHSLPGHSFDIRNSEVIKWLVSNPEVLQYLFDKANKSGFIIYNPKTGKWQGVNYDN